MGLAPEALIRPPGALAPVLQPSPFVCRGASPGGGAPPPDKGRIAITDAQPGAGEGRRRPAGRRCRVGEMRFCARLRLAVQLGPKIQAPNQGPLCEAGYARIEALETE